MGSASGQYQRDRLIHQTGARLAGFRSASSQESSAQQGILIARRWRRWYMLGDMMSAQAGTSTSSNLNRQSHYHSDHRQSGDAFSGDIGHPGRARTVVNETTVPEQATRLVHPGGVNPKATGLDLDASLSLG